MSIQIQSEGSPPERHADRIIAEMMRQLAVERAHHLPKVLAAISASSDGSPKAQRKMLERIKRTGVKQTKLHPGKRGRYSLHFLSMFGWDVAADAEILAGDPMPEQPQIAINLSTVRSKGGGHDRTQFISIPIAFITHHVLSRAAQRCGLRTAEDLTTTVQVMANAAMRLMNEKTDWETLYREAPRDGYRVEVQDKTIVFMPHETRQAIVATTIF